MYWGDHFSCMLLSRCLSISLYGWAFFISNIVLLMILLVIDEEENQFIENGFSKANKVFDEHCCLVPTLILSSYLWVSSCFESERSVHSRSWSSFMPPLRCLLNLIDSNAPQKSLTRITKLGKQTVSKKHSWNLKTRYAFLRFTMRGFQIEKENDAYVRKLKWPWIFSTAGFM